MTGKTSASSLSPIRCATIRDVTRRRYTEAEKADAVALYLDHGPTIASDQTGIPSTTISSWAQRSGLASQRSEKLNAGVKASKLAWEERRTTLAHEMGQVAELALERCHSALTGDSLVIDAVNAKGEHYDRIPNPSDAKNLALTMAILADKAQLLTGSATSRAEHATTPQVAAHLRDELAARRAQAAAA
jgi:transposase-like protein